MLISLAALCLVLTFMVVILVPQRATPTWRTHTVLKFSESYFLDIFVLKSTIDPEIVVVMIFTYCSTPLCLDLAHANKLILS